MLSGGIDSTYLLYDYVGSTNHPVHAHHISIRYPHQERWRAEDPACRHVVAWCRKHLRDFEYSMSRFDLEFRGVGWDSDLQLLVASKVALNLGRGRVTVALGWCTDDLERAPVRDRLERGVTTDLWRALCRSAVGPDLNEEIAMPIVERGLSKADIVDELPGELLELTWSCRSPILDDGPPSVCGKCHACELRARALGRVIELG